MNLTDRCAGREYARPAVTQREIVRLLSESPLPWTAGMLRAWFGSRHGHPFEQAIAARRVRRLERGLYSCPCKTPPKRTPITDEYIEKRWGIKL